MTRLSCAPRTTPRRRPCRQRQAAPLPTARARRSRSAVASLGSWPAALPFKTHTPRNADPQPRGVPCSSIPARSTPATRRNLTKNVACCGGPLRRAKSAPLSAISENFLRRTRPGRRLLSRRAFGNHHLMPLAGAVRLFSSNPTELLGIIFFRNRRPAQPFLPPCRMAPFPAAVRPA